MSTLTNIPRSHITQGQRRKEVTANTAMDGIAARVTDQATINLTGETASVTLPGLTVGVARVIRLTSADEALAISWPLDATYDAEDPTALEGEWTVINASGYDHTLQGLGGSQTIALADGFSQLVRFDGSEMYAVAGPVPTGYRGEYHAQVAFVEKPTSSENSPIHLVVDAVRLLATAPGSSGYAETVATADAVFQIHKNGVSIGTVTFPASTNAATFSVASNVDFFVGDRLRLVAPSSADATLADLAVNLRLLRI